MSHTYLRELTFYRYQSNNGGVRELTAQIRAAPVVLATVLVFHSSADCASEHASLIRYSYINPQALCNLLPPHCRLHFLSLSLHILPTPYQFSAPQFLQETHNMAEDSRNSKAVQISLPPNDVLINVVQALNGRVDDLTSEINAYTLRAIKQSATSNLSSKIMIDPSI